MSINRHVLVSRFGHLASLMWAAVFVMRCCLTFILLLPRALSLMSFPLTPVVGYIVVDMSQGFRLFAVFGFVFSRLFRNYM